MFAALIQGPHPHVFATEKSSATLFVLPGSTCHRTLKHPPTTRLEQAKTAH
jgi:predicted phosphodiesterase